MINLNLDEQVAEFSEPTRLILASQHKVGKTHLCTRLPKSFLVDGENSLGHFTARGFNVIKEAATNKYAKTVPQIDPATGGPKLDPKTGHPLTKKVKMTQTDLVLTEIPNSLRFLNSQNNGVPVFDFIILDTLTFLEKLARGLATKNYKSALIGRGFKGSDVVMELSNGAGYDWHRKAVEQFLDAYEGLYGKCLIITAHIKDASIMKKDGSATDLGRELAATGKLRVILPAKVDGTGYMYRSEKANENLISFITQPNDLSTGARNPHLTGREFVISRYHPETQVLETFWEEIFPSIKKI